MKQSARLVPAVPVTGDFDWAVNYLLPWLGKGIRRLPHGLGIERKRPVPTIVPKSPLRVDQQRFEGRFA